MKKRIVAFLLCLLMAVTSVPLSPLADYVLLEAQAASVRVESLEPMSTLSGGKLKMTKNTDETFKVMVLPQNASNKRLTWSSSATGVVSVSESAVSSSGIASVKLLAKGEGTAKISYATTDGSNIKGSFAVEVLPLVKSVKLNTTVKSITRDAKGERLIATVSPSDAGNQKLLWFSSDDSVCKVNYNGELTPVSTGECYISAVTTDGSDIVVSCRLVVSAKAKNVDINKSAVTVANGKTATLYATVTTADGSSHDAVKWTSSDEKIATVNNEGVVTAKYPGTVTIKASAADGSGEYDVCLVTVTQKIKKITLSSSTTVGVGSTKTLKPTISPSYATDKKLVWSSSNTSVATVSSSGVVTGKKIGTAKITCKNSDGSASATCTVKVIIPATGVSINSSSEELWKGKTVRLTAKVTPSNATDKSVTWSSSNTKVAKVSSSGVVTAVAGGKCTITVKNSAGKTAKCKIQVFESATGIELEEFIKTMYVGQTDTIKANVLPLTATERGVKWSSSNTAVAKVDSNGKISALKTGTATIIARSVDGGYKATCKLTVNKKVSVTGITLDKTSVTVKVGKTFQFLGMVKPSNASEKGIKWSTSDKSVATISSTGVLKGIKPGHAVITATSVDGNYTAKCKVTVTQPVTGISLSASSVSISVGNTKTLSWNVFPSNATTKSVVFKSSDTSVATVSSKGLVTAKKAGTATITVTTKDGGYSDTCKVTVRVPVKGVKVSVSSLKVPKGETRLVTAVVSPSNATNKKVTWSSNNQDIVRISSSGKITGVAKGTATITCRTEDGSYRASCKVTVVQLVEEIKLDVSSATLQKGKYKTISATVKPISASNTAVKWKSSDKKVVEVSSKGVVKAVGPGTATITVSSADGNAKATCKIKVIQPATGIKINEKEPMVRIGKKITLTATVLPQNATNKNVTWISSNKDRATVSADGVVKGISKGKVKITAKTADGAYSATCVVNVIKGVTGIKLDKKSVTMNVGKSTTLTPVITPKDASVKTVKWYSDNNDVATVDKNGKVTAKGQGHATITAKTTDGSLKATASVLVIEPVKSVKISPATAYVNVGGKTTLKPVFTPSDATIQSVKWSSSNTKVATVSSSGVVKGIKRGEATITCVTNNGKKVATCKVLVIKRVTDITLSHSREVLYFGSTLKLKATVYPSDATIKDYKFSSSNPSVAKVSADGVVTPVNRGKVKITVTTKDGEHTATCIVTVKKAPEGIKISTQPFSLKVGETKTVKYTITPADATNKTATFKSSNTKVATVNSKGVVKGVSKGTATITALTENGIKASVTVTVRQQVTSVEIDPTATVYTGKKVTVSARALPSSAQNKALTWSSSDTSVAKVTSEGVITGMRAGTAIITVKSEENPKLKATCKVTVKQRVISVEFDQRDVFVNKGASVDLGYTVYPADATNKKVTFKSSDSSVVSVTKDGRITAHKSGSAKITVTSQDNSSISAICYITAGEPVSGVSLEYTKKIVYVGDKFKIKETISPSDAYNKLVKWSSSDGARASINSKGEITALKSGTATITVTTVDGEYKASCVLTIRQRATKITTPKSKMTLNTGATYQLKATVLPEDCYDRTYKWTSADSSIAKVTSKGLVTAVAPGVVKLTCTSNESGLKTTVTLTVHQPVTSLEIKESNVTLYTPFTKKLSYTLLPSNASNKAVTWTSSDESVIKVSADGTVTAVGKGKATVTVKSKDTGISDSCKFTVFTGVEGITVQKSSYSLHENTSLTIGWSFKPSNVDDSRVTLKSSNTDVFTVDKNGTITGIKPGTANLTITSVQNPQVKKTVKITVTRAVTDLDINADELTLYNGESFSLESTITPADASNKSVVYKSSNSKVADVDADGKIRALSRGFAEITATTVDGGFTAKCSIEVIQLPKKVDFADSYTVYMGKAETLNVKVLPEDTNDKALTWKSSDESIATVDENGKVTPVKTGICYITASTIMQGVEKKIKITVAQLCQEIQIICRIPELIIGQRLRLPVTMLPATTTDKTVSWTSSDSSVASVDKYGVVTAVKAGTVQITATANDISKTKHSVSVKVVSPISGISLDKSKITLELGSEYTLEATVKPSTAYDKTVTFTSSDTKVATVDKNGKVKAVGKGQAVITATTADGAYSAKMTVTVIRSATDIALNKTEFSLKTGGKVRVEYSIVPADSSQTELTWKTSDSKVATVDQNGIITAVGKGTAKITLTVSGTSISRTLTVTVA